MIITLSEESAIPMIADEDAVDHIPKIPHNVIEVMVVLMVLLLALKLVQSGVPHTCGGGHDMTQCATAPLPPLPHFCWGWVESPNKFLKGSGLDRTIPIFRGRLLSKMG